jgi:hypothetical protein
MLTGTRKAAVPLLALALAALGAAGCGSGSDDDTTAPKPPPLTAGTASHLAQLSDRIATDLDAGETCDAAYAADQLQGAVQDAKLSPSLRPGVVEVASRLVDEVNCPPPPPEPKKKKKPEEHKGHGEDHGDGSVIPIPPGHGGVAPPGHAKLKGEDG